jgi:hypothetical protein
MSTSAARPPDPPTDGSDFPTELTPEMRVALAETCAFIIETRRQRLAQIAAEQAVATEDASTRRLEMDHGERTL